jgi:hypothetical protein
LHYFDRRRQHHHHSLPPHSASLRDPTRDISTFWLLSDATGARRCHAAHATGKISRY